MRERMLSDHAIATIAAVTATLILLQSPPAAAQRAADCAAIASDNERLACYDCAGLASDAERLACFDSALRPEPARPIAQAPQRTPRPAVAPAPAPPAAPAAAPAPAPSVAAPDARAAEARERTGSPNEREPFPIVVVALRRLDGRLSFITDGGEIWVQTDGRNAVLPDPPFAAEIKPGSMGSKFLVPANVSRAIRVVRRRE
jgi:hypothetical protein